MSVTKDRSKYRGVAQVYFGAVELEGITGSTYITKEDAFTGNISNSSTATLTLSKGGSNGRVMHTIGIEDSSPPRPFGSLVDVLIDGTVIGTIDMNLDPHYYFEGWEVNNKTFGVRTVTLQPNATFGASTVCIMSKYFYK